MLPMAPFTHPLDPLMVVISLIRVFFNTRLFYSKVRPEQGTRLCKKVFVVVMCCNCNAIRTGMLSAIILMLLIT